MKIGKNIAYIEHTRINFYNNWKPINYLDDSISNKKIKLILGQEKLARNFKDYFTRSAVKNWNKVLFKMEQVLFILEKIYLETHFSLQLNNFYITIFPWFVKVFLHHG